MLDLTYFRVAEWKLLEWQQAYPSLNIEGELQRMKQWLDANPRRRKKNYARFCVNWLNKESAKVESQAAQVRAYARVGRYETQHHATPERAQEVLEMIERQRAQKS